MLEIFLVSRDPKLVSTMQLVCAKAGIKIEVCSGADQGAALLARHKIYAVLIDDAVPSAAEFLRTVRESPSSSNAVSIAFVGGHTHATLGASLVVAKPVSAELAQRTLRAARGPMSSEFRRYFRYPLHAPVTIKVAEGQALQANCLNVSRGGLAVQFAEPQVINDKAAVCAHFLLPTTRAGIEMIGYVAWSSPGGSAGFRCHGARPNDQKLLEEWMATLPVVPDLIRPTGPGRIASA